MSQKLHVLKNKVLVAALVGSALGAAAIANELQPEASPLDTM